MSCNTTFHLKNVNYYKEWSNRSYNYGYLEFENDSVFDVYSGHELDTVYSYNYLDSNVFEIKIDSNRLLYNRLLLIKYEDSIFYKLPKNLHWKISDLAFCKGMYRENVKNIYSTNYDSANCQRTFLSKELISTPYTNIDTIFVYLNDGSLFYPSEMSYSYVSSFLGIEVGRTKYLNDGVIESWAVVGYQQGAGRKVRHFNFNDVLSREEWKTQMKHK